MWFRSIKGAFNSFTELLSRIRDIKMTEINTANLIDQMRAMIAQSQGAPSEVGAGQESFGAVFQQALGQASDLNKSAETLRAKYEVGDPNVSLSDVMVGTQKANLGFEAALIVRNKVVQAYQDIMGMSV